MAKELPGMTVDFVEGFEFRWLTRFRLPGRWC